MYFNFLYLILQEGLRPEYRYQQPDRTQVIFWEGFFINRRSSTDKYHTLKESS